MALPTWARRFAGPALLESELGRNQILTVEPIDAGFPEGDSNYNCCMVGSDGRVYFAVSTHDPDRYARLYCFDPPGHRLELVADIGEGAGGADAYPGSLAHGKIHVDLFELDGKLLTATHRSVAPGARPYPGGRFLELDIRGGGLNVVGAAPPEEGIISMAVDQRRGRLYGLTWPGGLLLSCDLAARVTTTMGRVFGRGERGRIQLPGSAPICRSLALEPTNGTVYWSDSRGRIRSYSPGTGSVTQVPGCRLTQSGFRCPDIWRQALWHPVEKVFYGVMFRRNGLFRFDPYRETVGVVDHIPAVQYRKKWAWTEPRATLALRLAPDGETLYYLASGPPLLTSENRRVRRTLHFITYHLPTGRYRDLGVLRLPDGRYPVYCQSMAVHDRTVYAVCWIEIPPGFKKGGTEAIRRARAAFAPVESEGRPEEVNLVRFSVPDHDSAGAWSETE